MSRLGAGISRHRGGQVMRWRGAAREMAGEDLETVSGISRAAKGISREPGCHVASFRPRVASFGIKVARSRRRIARSEKQGRELRKEEGELQSEDRELRNESKDIGDRAHE